MPACLGPPLQRGDPLGHRQGVPQELVALGELQVVDHVDQQQGHVGLVRGVAVQVFGSRGIAGRPLDVHTAWRLIVLSASSLRALSVATSSAIVSFRSLRTAFSFSSLA